MRSYRYLLDFDMSTMDCEYSDVLIIGSGIAGVYTALEIPTCHSVSILTKEALNISNSVLAQGGIAVSLDKNDSPRFHFNDTIYAGAGLCDEESVWVLVNEAAKNIEKICQMGVVFDKEGDTELALTREAAHSMKRIIHSGDTTGKAVLDRLIYVVQQRENIQIFESTLVVDILTEDGCCKGVLVYDEKTKTKKAYLSNIVICATGGFGQIYANTTNPEVATGDGVSMAHRAGAELMDLEFIQFHPTVLFHTENNNFLISEAVRGEGAQLRNIKNKRFMDLYHELAELAPRDVVSRSIFEEMKKTNAQHVYLDITFLEKEYLEKRFPNIFATCLKYGIDISKDYIPVAPAEHYCMGGIKTDAFGRTSIKGFYSCGEAACNAIHGANRLASNSLLEGLVFGSKIGEEITNILKDHTNGIEFSMKYSTDRVKKDIDAVNLRDEIKSLMNDYVGIIRDKIGLLHALDTIKQIRESICDMKNTTMEDLELHNMANLSQLVIESALEREESRGAHYRSDFPRTDDKKWKTHIIK